MARGLNGLGCTAHLPLAGTAAEATSVGPLMGLNCRYFDNLVMGWGGWVLLLIAASVKVTRYAHYALITLMHEVLGMGVWVFGRPGVFWDSTSAVYGLWAWFPIQQEKTASA